MLRALLLPLLGIVFFSVAVRASGPGLAGEELRPLPPSLGQVMQPGVAGPFAGVHGDALIVAGGANFPAGRPWEGGAKMWWDDIWVLEKLSSATPRWARDVRLKLPRPLGYGISVSVPEGVICVGGQDAERCYADVFLLTWDATQRELRRTDLPPLPQPLSFMAGAIVGNALYVAGGQSVMTGAVPLSVFWRLDWSARGRPNDFKWEQLPSWPGPPRILPVAAAAADQDGGGFYLFGGRTPRAGAATELLRDAYVYNPDTRRWRTLPPVGGGTGVSVMGATAATAGRDTILIFGGDRGDVFRELEGHDLAISGLRAGLAAASAGERSTREKEIAARLEAKRRLYENHSGFSRTVLAFDPRNGTWRVHAEAPAGLPVTTVAVKTGAAVVIPSGEIQPGVRTASVMRWRVE